MIVNIEETEIMMIGDIEEIMIAREGAIKLEIEAVVAAGVGAIIPGLVKREVEELPRTAYRCLSDLFESR